MKTLVRLFSHLHTILVTDPILKILKAGPALRNSVKNDATKIVRYLYQLDPPADSTVEAITYRRDRVQMLLTGTNFLRRDLDAPVRSSRSLTLLLHLADAHFFSLCRHQLVKVFSFILPSSLLSPDDGSQQPSKMLIIGQS